MSCQKVNFKKLAENETLEVDIGKVNLEALSCDTYLGVRAHAPSVHLRPVGSG